MLLARLILDLMLGYMIISYLCSPASMSCSSLMLVLILSGKQEVASGNRSENKAKPT
jgi:hypothetical protein